MTRMATEREEDLLEAILESPDLESADLACRLGIEPADLAAIEEAAMASGRLARDGAGRPRLTHEGHRIARQIARRHRTLACFFEQLGMARDAADREACTLEHGVSDEAIARLADHIRCPARRERPCEGGWRGTEADGTPLLDYGEGDRVCITAVRRCGRYRRLMDMGVVPGETVVVRRRLSNRAIVIEVKGCEIGLSPECAATVFASPCP
ncbi:Iron dependent repressor, metal binding and dimerization domain [anaerobic digester metagenome]